jgi:hypothetical protein
VSNVPQRGVKVIIENIPPKCEVSMWCDSDETANEYLYVTDILRIDHETVKELGNYKLAVKSKYSTAVRKSDCSKQ